MALDWVQEALRKSLGFAPYPATLNVRPSKPQDARLWQEIKREIAAVPMAPIESGFCSARLYFVGVQRLKRSKELYCFLLWSITRGIKSKSLPRFD
jgi:CTP-dependent riboflavin kinase